LFVTHPAAAKHKVTNEITITKRILCGPLVMHGAAVRGSGGKRQNDCECEFHGSISH
jgi:hypothetical protein